MKNDGIFSLLGLAAKAGKAKSGEFLVERTVKDHKAFAVIIATDCSESSKKSYRDMCSYYKVPLFEYGTKEELGHCIGKEFRAAVAIDDEGFSKGIIKKLATREENK